MVKKLDVVTLGETMVLFEPMEGGNVQYAPLFRKTIGGAESNIAIGLAKLGHRVSWISKLGDDPFGKFIYSFIKGEGVDVEHVKFVKERQTAVFFKETGKYKRTNIYYFRRESVASTLSPNDIDEQLIRKAKFLHVTGITPALSESCAETVLRALELAKKYRVKIVFDPNVRLTLNPKDEYFQLLRQIAFQSDYFYLGKQN